MALQDLILLRLDTFDDKNKPHCKRSYIKMCSCLNILEYIFSDKKLQHRYIDRYSAYTMANLLLLAFYYLFFPFPPLCSGGEIE
jgi:hypothetical protein